MSDENKTWYDDELENFALGCLKQDFRLSMTQFQKQYLAELESFNKQAERCETKAVRGDERCAEDGVERLIDDQTVYLCDKCYESFKQSGEISEFNHIKKSNGRLEEIKPW